MEQLTAVGLTNPALLAIAVELLFLFTMRIYREALRHEPATLERWNDLASIVALLGQAAAGYLTGVLVIDALLRGLGVAGTLAVAFKLLRALRPYNRSENGGT